MNSGLKILSAVIAALAVGIGSAWADDGKRFPLSAAYQEECGSCHVPYPPRLLTAPSWKALMAGLDRHFGSDASLDAAKAREIENFLLAGSGRSERFEPSMAQGGSSPRITETPWFQRKHRDGHDGLTASVWKSPQVQRPANCGACHARASEGDYSERDIHIPRTR